MKKLFIATLFTGLALSAQAQELPKECTALLDYMKAEVEASPNKPSEKEIQETLKGAAAEFQAAVKQNGEKAAAAGCAEMHKMLQEMKQAK